MQKGLGRHPAEDERDEQYLLQPRERPEDVSSRPGRADPPGAVGSTGNGRKYRYWWPSGWWGDQGTTPQCVAFAWVHFLEDGPVTHAPFERGEGPVAPCEEVYSEAQERDVWPGTDYAGTSVRGGAKALQARGLIDRYEWARSVETVVQALLTEGPLVMGSNWYRSMYEPDDEGFVRPEGEVVGGHAYLLNGVNREEEKVRFKNSWGVEWGAGGYGWMRFEDLETLLTGRGEACFGRFDGSGEERR